MTVKIQIQNILPDTSFTCFVVPQLFSKEECDQLLNTDIKSSFQKATSNYPTYYRNNERRVIDSKDLAIQLFQKVKTYLPDTIEVNSNIRAENGVWHLNGLNDRLRFCKYTAGQYFNRHLDGVHYQSETTQSKLTFMIYLNGAEAFKGGRTLFFKTKEATDVWAAYIPQQGDLIVFDHNVWHEGEVLQEGEKFVLRSDILYSKKTQETYNEPFAGHLGYIWSLLKINDHCVVSGGRDKEIKVWTDLGEQIYSLKGHQNSILCIEKLSENTFVSGSRDQQIIVWKDYKMVNTIKVHTAVVLSLCALGSNTFASASGDHTIKILSLDGQVLKTLDEHTNWVWKVIKLSDNIIASCSEDKTIKIWNIDTEKSIQTFFENEPIMSLCYHEPKGLLVSGNLSGDLTIRTLAKDDPQQNLKTFKAHVGIVRTIKFIDHKHVATGGEDNKVRIWDLEGRLISELAHQNFVQSIELLDHNTMLSASYDGTIKTWEITV